MGLNHADTVRRNHTYSHDIQALAMMLDNFLMSVQNPVRRLPLLHLGTVSQAILMY